MLQKVLLGLHHLAMGDFQQDVDWGGAYPISQSSTSRSLPAFLGDTGDPTKRVQPVPTAGFNVILGALSGTFVLGFAPSKQSHVHPTKSLPFALKLGHCENL